MGVAQLVERQVVALDVAGSIPVAHPKKRPVFRGVFSSIFYFPMPYFLFGDRAFWKITLENGMSIRGPSAPLAQLDRASGFEPEGREFESLTARKFCASKICPDIRYTIYEKLPQNFVYRISCIGKNLLVQIFG